MKKTFFPKLLICLLLLQACSHDSFTDFEAANTSKNTLSLTGTTSQGSKAAQCVDLKLVSLKNSPNYFVKSLVPEKEFSLEVTVQNIGSLANFNQTVFADLFFSQDTQFNSTDFFVQRVKVADDLQAGQIFSFVVDGIICPEVPAGNYFILIRLDPDNDIDESCAPIGSGQGEANNTNAQAIPPSGTSSLHPRVAVLEI